MGYDVYQRLRERPFNPLPTSSILLLFLLLASGMRSKGQMKEHILVVDDEAPIRDLLGEFFRRRGYTVTTAATGEDALRLADEVVLQLVILDIALPDADGL